MSTETNPDAYDIFNDFKEAQQQGITLPKLDAPITMAHVKKVLDDAGVASDFIPDRLLAQQLTVQKDFSTQGMLDQNAKFLWYLVQLQKERLARYKLILFIFYFFYGNFYFILFRSRSEPVSSLEKQLANILRERLVLIIKASPPSLVASKRAIELALPKVRGKKRILVVVIFTRLVDAILRGSLPGHDDPSCYRGGCKWTFPCVVGGDQVHRLYPRSVNARGGVNSKGISCCEHSGCRIRSTQRGCHPGRPSCSELPRCRQPCPFQWVVGRDGSRASACCRFPTSKRVQQLPHKGGRHDVAQDQAWQRSALSR